MSRQRGREVAEQPLHRGALVPGLRRDRAPVSISLVKVVTALCSSCCCISAMPRSISGALLPDRAASVHCSQIAALQRLDGQGIGRGLQLGEQGIEHLAPPGVLRDGARAQHQAERTPQGKRERRSRAVPRASARRSPNRAARRYAPPECRCPTRCCRRSRNCRRRSRRASRLSMFATLRRAGGATARAAAPGRCRPSRSRDGRRARPSRRSPPRAAASWVARRPSGRAAWNRPNDRQRSAAASVTFARPTSTMNSLTSLASFDTRAALSFHAGSCGEHVAIVLHRRAAARGVDDDGVELLSAARRRCCAWQARAPARCGRYAAPTSRSSPSPRHSPPRRRAASAAAPSPR